MKKLKPQYRALRVVSFYERHLLTYPQLRNAYYKHFSTRQEKSFFYLHRIEYKAYPLKLRAARGKSLADPWDDYPSNADSLAKSWKHNAKRRHQYYR